MRSARTMNPYTCRCRVIAFILYFTCPSLLYAQTQAPAIPLLANAPAAIIMPAPPAGSAAMATAPTPAPADQPKDISPGDADQSDELDTGPAVHSLFFTTDEMALLMQAAKAYERFKMASSSDAQSQAKDFLSQLEEARKTGQFEKNFEYPQFFLESLMYHTPDDWFLQVNGQKLSPDKREKFGLKVITVDSDKVLFEWKPLNMQLVNDTWTKMHNEEVIINRKTGTVTFWLRSNQTFTSYLMRVVEGKVKPVRLENPNDMGNKSSKDKKLSGGIGGMSLPSPGNRPLTPPPGVRQP